MPTSSVRRGWHFLIWIKPQINVSADLGVYLKNAWQAAICTIMRFGVVNFRAVLPKDGVILGVGSPAIPILVHLARDAPRDETKHTDPCQ
ncbi:MAG: hypothetical protein GTO41_13840 [Burkholderiales bacterium]|nr:hypothetical protein [Burkholderiales bacterium]